MIIILHLFIIVQVPNLSNHESLKEKNRKVMEVLFNRASLVKDKKGNKIEVKTSGNRLTIALSIFI